MGEIAEDMMDGTLCRSCGALNDDFIAAGEKQASGARGAGGAVSRFIGRCR